MVIAQDSSSQHRNRDIAFERLIEKLVQLNYVPKKRYKTKPTRSSVEKRIESKKKRGGIKTQRKTRVTED